MIADLSDLEGDTYCFVNCGKSEIEGCACLRRMRKKEYRKQLMEDISAIEVEEKDEEEK